MYRIGIPIALQVAQAPQPLTPLVQTSDIRLLQSRQNRPLRLFIFNRLRGKNPIYMARERHFRHALIPQYPQAL
jgi:hypothetical protein